jgi:hypothetical protein
MKVVDFMKTVVYFVETDESNYSFYTRYDADNWTKRMGESDEPIFDCEELERQFQIKLLKDSLLGNKNEM